MSVAGSQSGIIGGSFSVSASNLNQLIFTPSKSFQPGELVTVQVLAGQISSALGNVYPSGYVFQFTAASNQQSEAVNPIASNLLSDRIFTSQEVAIGDLSGDGIAEIIYIDQNGSVVMSMLTTDGQLASTVTIGSLSTNSSTKHKLKLIDVNEDGLLDVVVNVYKELIWYENLGNNSFAQSKSLVFLSENDTPSSYDLVDLTGDGFRDVVYMLAGGGRVSMRTATGNGTYANTIQVLSQANSKHSHLQVVDMDNDGDLDVVAFNQDDEKLFILTNDGSGAFTEEEILTNKYPHELISWNIYQDLDKLSTDEEKEILQIKTHYEKLFTAKGSVIKYAKFRID
jgi:hypothetical protein